MNEKRNINEKQVRIGRISYINVAPVYYGLDRGLRPSWLDMITEPPAVLNGMLERGDIVMSPVSSAAYAKNHKNWILMPDVSISCFGKVMSVILVSRYPIHELTGKRVVFTEESATGAALVRYFFIKNNVTPVIETRKITGVESVLHDADAALIIGDTALVQNWPGSFTHVYDLGDMWRSMAGLPFVFAVWAIRRDFAEDCPDRVNDLKSLFSQSKKMGKENMNEIIDQASLKTGLSQDLCREYFDHLECDLSPLYIKGLETFFDGLYETGLLTDKVRVETV